MARALIAALLLSGCGAAVAETEAPDTRMLERRIVSLETELEELRAEVQEEQGHRQRIVDAAISDLRDVHSEVERLSETDQALQDNIDFLGRYHNVAPARRE